MNSINVLSLFDGMSCGQIALERAGIPINKYFASEIDKYCIKITQKNYPNTIQLGDVKDINPKVLPEIDLLMGGSPCQGFSTAGSGLNFEDPRSKLFFNFVEILEEIKPKWFLLENVKMKQEWVDIITDYIGVEPVEINSSLVSAQRRVRLYWTNLPVTQPEDKEIYLDDIIENGVVDRLKSYCLDSNYYKGGNPKSYFKKSRRQLVFDYAILQRGRGKNDGGIKAKNGKVPTLSTSSWEHNNYLYNIPRNAYRKLTPLECERLQTVPEGYTEGVSDTRRYMMLGNGWTVNVIAHILKGIRNESRNEHSYRENSYETGTGILQIQSR